MTDVGFVCISNNESVLKSNLLRSEDLRGAEVEIERNPSSATRGLNAAMERLRPRVDLIVLVHQDVFLPEGWVQRLLMEIERLPEDWGVIGSFGFSEGRGTCGRVWSTGQGRELGRKLKSPQPAISLDELLLVVRAESGLRFDENLDGFHLYATDLVLMAALQKLPSFVVDLPVVHNSRALFWLDRSYRRAQQFLRRKYPDVLPISSMIIPVDRFGMGVWRYNLGQKLNRAFRRSPQSTKGVLDRDQIDPQEISLRLQYPFSPK